MENNDVRIPFNFLGIYTVEQLQRKSKGEKEKFAVQCPAVVHKYNQLMGGVDLDSKIFQCEVANNMRKVEN